jgi:hypothetical protein
MRFSFNSSSRIRQAQHAAERGWGEPTVQRLGKTARRRIGSEEEELAHHRKRACRSSKPREASRTRTARPKALGKKGFVHISLCNFEFRLGA